MFSMHTHRYTISHMPLDMAWPLHYPMYMKTDYLTYVDNLIAEADMVIANMPNEAPIADFSNISTLDLIALLDNQ